jgi:hypothetical protein
MKAGILSAIFIGLALGAAYAQDATPAPPPLQTPGVGPGGWQSLEPNTPRGRGMDPGGRPGMAPGRGVQGTVTAVAADHYTIKNDAGETYTVSFSANTRIMKQPAPRSMPGQAPQTGANSMAAPVQLKPTDIKVGDPIAALGQVDPATKSVGAMVVLLIDPERAKMMREMQANYGKTWLQGKVTAISGTSVTLQGSIDNASHTFVADENTTFRKHRDPVTLADVQVGDIMRVEGAQKDGTFVAAKVMVMGMPQQQTPNVPASTTPPADAQPK